jgi:hypothetical protein
MQKARWQITATIRRRSALTGLVVLCLYKVVPSYAAVKDDILNKHSAAKNKFYKAADLRSELSIPLMSKSRTVNIPKRQINARLSRYKSDPIVEPLQLTVSLDEDKILDLAQKIARPNSKLEVANYLKKNYPSSESIPNTSLRLVNLEKPIFEHINHQALASLFSKKQHEVNLSGNYLRHHPKARTELLHQVEPFMTKRELNSLKDKINTSQMLRLDKDLLPGFARKRVGRHTIFKGPNCFHAALAFQSDALASSSLVNVRQEPGYHRNMVNYDELWRVLQLSFYEINPTKTPLQYGDMIVFFETSEKTNGSIDFKTLRHAATYLLGGYVFSKGSKSANSPYIVSTLGEEWDIWTRYTKKLGLKVFRRSLKNVTTAPPVDRIDWVY